MKTIDLIKQLQALVDTHNSDGSLEVMGEHEIVIDCFRPYKGDKLHLWEYAGFSGNIVIDRSQDGVYPILTAEGTFV